MNYYCARLKYEIIRPATITHIMVCIIIRKWFLLMATQKRSMRIMTVTNINYDFEKRF